MIPPDIGKLIDTAAEGNPDMVYQLQLYLENHMGDKEEITLCGEKFEATLHATHGQVYFKQIGFWD